MPSDPPNSEPNRIRRMPPRFPPPEFPPRRPKLFARTPPAIFPVLLGLIGLGLALRRGLWAMDLPGGAGDLWLGLVVPIWAFALVAYLVKLARRPAVLVEDMRVLPGRAGLAAATMGGMAAAAAIAPLMPGLAAGLVWVMLAGHAALALLLIRVLLAMPAEGRGVTPAHHLAFVGFVVGAQALALIGQAGIATAIFYATMPVAVLIWAVSLLHLIRRIPPAPLRPMLAIHLAPASLFASVAALTGQLALAQGAMVLATAILLALLVSARWLLAAGFSAVWGALTFPLTAYATAALTLGGGWFWPGLAVLALALGLVPWIGWRIVRLWPQGTLAAKTNAAEA